MQIQKLKYTATKYNATLRYHFSKYKELDPKFVQQMLESFYADNLLSGDESVQLTYDLYLKAKTRLAKGGFKLREGKQTIANSESVLIAQRT